MFPLTLAPHLGLDTGQARGGGIVNSYCTTHQFEENPLTNIMLTHNLTKYCIAQLYILLEDMHLSLLE